MIRIIRSAKRYHFNTDWLSSYWHFSFDHYHDPNNMNFGPLRVFNDDRIQPNSGFPMHGHREMEIVTYVLDGELEHKDSTGGTGRIGPGDVQRMSAGTGIQHSEYNPSSASAVHLLQLWITPSKRGLAPSYEQRRFDDKARRGRLLPVASGRDGVDAMHLHQDATIFVSSLDPRQSVGYSMDPDRRAYLFVIDGEIELSGSRLAAGDQGRIENEAELEIAAALPTELIFLDLP
jgi:redox-sensitive bicupin YhaK (pirin superfamily)